MAEEKWVLKFNRKTMLGSVYNPGEMASFVVKDAQLILKGEPSSDIDDPNYGKPVAEVVRKLSAEEVERIESNGQPLKVEQCLTIDTSKMTAAKLRKLQLVLEEEQTA